MKKQGNWTPNEVYYLVNHVDVLTKVMGSFDSAVEEIAYRLNRATTTIKNKYNAEKRKNAHRAG